MHRLVLNYEAGNCRDHSSDCCGPASIRWVRETAEQPLDESLKDYLSERRLLLLLDNFEQVLGAAPAVTEMIAGAPELRVLVTSRAPLGLYGEKEYAVPPLSVPDVRHLPDFKTLS